MKGYLLLFVIFLLSVHCIAQKFTHKLNYRFSFSQQIVNVWTDDSIAFHGTITNSTRHIVYTKNRRHVKRSKIITREKAIDTSAARQGFNLFQTIANIPSDRTIKGWVQGLDGINYTIERSTLSGYDVRSYWTPTAQSDSVVEAKRIQSFVNNLDTVLQLTHTYKVFFSKLKPGNYTDGMMNILKFTAKENERRGNTAPERAYVNSIMDTLDHYLSNTLTKYFSEQTDIEYSNTYIFTLSSDNHLINVTKYDSTSEIVDKKAFQLCKRRLNKAFKMITINFVHPKIPFVVDIDISGGKVEVSHRTLL